MRVANLPRWPVVTGIERFLRISKGSEQVISKAVIMDILNYQVVFREEDEGGFTVTVPDLPGCVTFEKQWKAMEMVNEAIELYIESLQAHGEEIKEIQD